MFNLLNNCAGGIENLIKIGWRRITLARLITNYTYLIFSWNADISLLFSERYHTPATHNWKPRNCSENVSNKCIHQKMSSRFPYTKSFIKMQSKHSDFFRKSRHRVTVQIFQVNISLLLTVYNDHCTHSRSFQSRHLWQRRWSTIDCQRQFPPQTSWTLQLSCKPRKVSRCIKTSSIWNCSVMSLCTGTLTWLSRQAYGECDHI